MSNLAQIQKNVYILKFHFHHKQSELIFKVVKKGYLNLKTNDPMSNLLHLWFVLESQELKIYKDETVSFFFVKFYLQQFKKSIYFLL